MAHATAYGIRIGYETFGDASSPALLLIAGNGAQLLFWDAAFCRALADNGLHVIRFDNRDAGLSGKCDAAGVPDIMATIQAAMAGQPVRAPYTLSDMADDAVGLLGALGIATAHICGASMGGMIAQVVAYRHPQRVRSLTSIMSNTGNPTAPQAKPEAIAAVVAPPPTQRDAYVAHSLAGDHRRHCGTVAPGNGVNAGGKKRRCLRRPGGAAAPPGSPEWGGRLRRGLGLGARVFRSEKA